MKALSFSIFYWGGKSILEQGPAIDEVIGELWDGIGLWQNC